MDREMARWLLRGPQPVIVIDWADLKADKSWCLLRAAVLVGGRTLTLLDMVFPGREQGSLKTEKRFLQCLHTLMPDGIRLLLVTDAGFRTPWFRAVEARGWHWLGRLRGWARVKPLDVEEHPEQWVDCRQLHVLAPQSPHELLLMQTHRSDPITCCLVVHAKPPRGRKHRTLQGDVARTAIAAKRRHASASRG